MSLPRSHATVLIAILTLAACLSHTAKSQPSASLDPEGPHRAAIPQQVWFAPLSSVQAGPNNTVIPYAEVDFLKLFAPGSPWPNARARTQVFKIYSQLAYYASDAELRTVFDFLNQQHIALAMEAGALRITSQCGAGVEGFIPSPQVAAQMALRIRSLGGDLKYIAMDEPLYHGRYYSGPNACHYPVATLALQVAATVQAWRSVFPDVEVGDIEPLNAYASFPVNADTWQATTAEWIDAFQTLTGTPLAFFHDDADWSIRLSLYVPQLQSLLAEKNIPFGMIYDGTDNPVSDSGWMAATEEHIHAFNHSGDAPPAQVIFQSWNPYPTHALPEASPTALTHLIDYYFSPAAELSPYGDASRDMIILPGGATQYRSTCSLAALGDVRATPVSQVAYSYCLVLARAADASGLNSYSTAIASHQLSLPQVLLSLYSSPEFQGKFQIAAMSNEEFVTFLYGLIFYRIPTPEELVAYSHVLDSGQATRAALVAYLVQSPDFHSQNPILGAMESGDTASGKSS